MSRRDNRAARCLTCQMFTTLCICDLVPRLHTRTRLALLVHYREARKPTNTGLLAARCVDGSSVELVGKGDRAIGPVVADDEVALVLYPDDDAVPIEAVAATADRFVLIVPDGNWRQAGKMLRRIPRVAAARRVRLTDTAPSAYRLRAEPRAEGLATLEAIARALGILERDRGPEIQAAMLAVFRVMVERTLWLRGALRDDEVTGGVPAAALAERRSGPGSPGS